MAKNVAMNFVHLFEKMSEPLGLGLRGGGGGDGDPRIYFFYENQQMMDAVLDNNAMKATIGVVQGRMREAKSKGMNIEMTPVRTPRQMPDLRMIHSLCPRNINFCYFVPQHQKAFIILKEIFMKQRDTDELFSLCCACRDSPMINNQLFVYALCSCLVSRPDTKHIPIPNHFEIMPESYCTNDVVKQAKKIAHMPEMPKGAPNNKLVIMIDKNVSGRGTDPEQRLWYFREDILVNSHHFHWHIVFPICSPKSPNAPGYRDRRGELFYYMHHSMIARYDAERLCNGLPRANKFNFNKLMLEEGYFGKLSSENSSVQWGTRQANTRLTDVALADLAIRVEELTRWRDRIRESIDIGYYIKLDDKGNEVRVRLDGPTGIDVLGDMVESSANLSPHPGYYGAAGFHNMGHVLIAASHDPTGKFNEKFGVMGDVSTAMRDPAFYRWHKYIDDLFDVYKQTLKPYPLDSKNPRDLPLIWRGIEVIPTSFYVKSTDSQNRNVLKTFWSTTEVDLARGLDFRRTGSNGMKNSPVLARFAHLDHAPFDYFMKINNNTGRPVSATIRIFMAPKYDEHNEPFNFAEQRLLFFEMDKVSQKLKPGVNDVRIASADSSVTLRDSNGSSFKRLETIFSESKSRDDYVKDSQCSCGWPQHLLLPRGTTGGTEYDLFVIVTDGAVDNVPDLNRRVGCNSALSFCGVLNQKYPDARPMGYPLDRAPYQIPVMQGADEDLTMQCNDASVPVSDLAQYVRSIKNSSAISIRIVHERMMKMDEAQMEEQMMSPDGTCIQMKDFYNQPSRREQGGGRPPPRDKAPPRPIGRPGQFSQPDEEQWAGVGGRKGRDYDHEDDWEELGGHY